MGCIYFFNRSYFKSLINSRNLVFFTSVINEPHSNICEFETFCSYILIFQIVYLLLKSQLFLVFRLLMLQPYSFVHQSVISRYAIGYWCYLLSVLGMRKLLITNIGFKKSYCAPHNSRCFI